MCCVAKPSVSDSIERPSAFKPILPVISKLFTEFRLCGRLFYFRADSNGAELAVRMRGVLRSKPISFAQRISLNFIEIGW